MDYKPGKNAEGYDDPTASEAIYLIGVRKKAKRLVLTLGHMAALAGFRLGPFRLQDRNGKVFCSDELLRD